MTTDKPTDALLPCRECGADCRVEYFPTQCGGPCDVPTWLCSHHHMFGGACPSDTAYLTAEAWNTRPQSAAPSPDADLVERVARAIHDARYGNDYPNASIRTWEQEDVAGQEYCARLATAAIEALTATAPPTTLHVELVERATPDDFKAVEGLMDHAKQFNPPSCYVAAHLFEPLARIIATAALAVPPSDSDEWRCVNCKHVVAARMEPDRCAKCGCSTFAHIVPRSDSDAKGGGA